MQIHPPWLNNSSLNQIWDELNQWASSCGESTTTKASDQVIDLSPESPESPDSANAAATSPQTTHSSSAKPPHRIWVVGGAVRDFLLKRSTTDIDVVILPEVGSRAALNIAPDVGRRLSAHYPVWRIEAYPYVIDFAIARADVNPQGRHSDTIAAADLHTDAARRDFTINSIYCDLSGNLFDPFGGISDLESSTLRFIGSAENRIREDFLRVLRLVRMLCHTAAQQCDGTILNTALSLSQQANSTLSRERIRDEVFKILTSDGFCFWHENLEVIGILDSFLPTGANWAAAADSLHNARAGGYPHDALAALAHAYAPGDHPTENEMRADSTLISKIVANSPGNHGLKRHCDIVNQLKLSLRLSRAQSKTLHNFLDRLYFGLALNH